MKCKSGYSLLLHFATFILALVSVALPSWYTHDLHDKDGNIKATRTYGLFFWSGGKVQGLNKTEYDAIKESWAHGHFVWSDYKLHQGFKEGNG